MKKVIVIFSVCIMILFSVTACKKECTCTSTQKYVGIDDDFFDDIVSVSSGTIDKGKCSDMNVESTSSLGGVTVKQTVHCVDK